MIERMTSIPEDISLSCVNLSSQVNQLTPCDMTNVSGGCILPGEDPLEHIEDLYDDIFDMVSEWWGT